MSFSKLFFKDSENIEIKIFQKQKECGWMDLKH